MLPQRKIFYSKIHFYLIASLAFLLPLGKILWLCIALLIINWLLQGNFKSRFASLQHKKFILLFCSIYIIYAIGLFNSVNKYNGSLDLQIKCSLFMFPLIFASSSSLDFSKIKNVLLCFIAGNFLASCVCLFKALYVYLTTQQNHFFYEEFSVFLHPSYFAMYVNFAVVSILYLMFKEKFKNNYFDYLLVFLIFFFTIIVLLLSSKMGIFTLLLIYLGYIFFLIAKHKKYLSGIVTLFLLMVVIFISINYFPSATQRINTIKTVLLQKNIDNKESESTTVRILIWKASVSIIKENFLFGVGTGDANDELVKEYEKKGMTGALEHKLNAHNQFLQTFIELGVIGFVLLLLIFILPFYQAMKSGNSLYMLFLIIIALNILVESMLERQSGIIFYTFFNSLMFFNKRNNL